MLIVSVQNFSNYTQQIVNQLNNLSDIFAIRTDTPIKTKYKIIGLNKNSQKYYITTKIKDIDNVAKWADYVAIDCRHKNKNLSQILDHCIQKSITIIADIFSKKDIDNLIKYQSIIAYIATTFCFDKNIRKKCNIIEYAHNKGFKVIAEGGYSEKNDIKKALKSGASHVCIGAAIFDYLTLTKKYIGYCCES